MFAPVSTLKRLFFILALCQLSACSSVYFFPAKTQFLTPDQIALDYQEVWLTSADNTKIHAWWLPSSNAKTLGSVYYLHGNGQNISSHIHAVSWLPAQGYNVLLIDYRGYGQSEGTATLPEVFLDLQAGLDWLQAKQLTQPIYVLGQSMGGALSAYYFSVNPEAKKLISGLAVDAAFADYGQMLDLLGEKNRFIHWFKYPIGWALEKDYSALPFIQQLSPTPLLLMHSEKDEVIPYSQGLALYSKAQQPKFFVRSAGQHNSSFAYPDCRQKLLDFMQNKLSELNTPQQSKIGCQY